MQTPVPFRLDAGFCSAGSDGWILLVELSRVDGPGRLASVTGRERYARYRDDSTVSAAIGEHNAAQIGRVTVWLLRAVAEAAVKAWERDEGRGSVTRWAGVPFETHEQYMQRDRAAELAFVGLAISIAAAGRARKS
ncbi:hypothetical protein [Kitasatospora griseola]|uniref:hypothetical protein n=1 Tax=Kitasatospora griseola TaxID=2064 RepID=UPI00366344AC